jgi:hypothetical protein
MEPLKFAKTADNFSTHENVKCNFFRMDSRELILRNEVKLEKIKKNDESYYASRKKKLEVFIIIITINFNLYS